MKKTFLFLTLALCIAAATGGCIKQQAKAIDEQPSSDKQIIKQTKIEDKKSTVKLDVAKLSAPGKAAYENLLKAERFEEGHVGYAGTLSKYIVDFNTLLRERAADEAFKSLLAEAPLAGQLYALCGIYFTDHELFLKEIEKYKTSGEEVETMSGCMISVDRVSKIVESDQPFVAIINYGETIDEWRARTKKESYMLDIAHGGFPATFKSFGEKRKAEER